MGGEKNTCPCAIIVDPYVLARPAVLDAKVLADYFHRLVQWSRVLCKGEAATSSMAVSALRDAGQYPDFSWTKDVMRRLGIDDWSPVDIQNALRVLCDRAPYAEDLLELKDIDATVTLEPSIVSDRLPESVATAFKLLLAGSVAWCQERATPLPEVGTIEVAGDEILLEGHIALVEHPDGGIKEPLKQAITERFDLVQDPNELLCVDYSARDFDLILGIRAMHAECLTRADASTPELGEIRIGPHFKQSLETCGITTQPAMLKKLCRVCAMAATRRLANLAGAKLHAVRETEAADAPQVIRKNGDRKWRCMLTKTGAGLRLHYWEGTDGVTELDQVLVESEV